MQVDGLPSTATYCHRSATYRAIRRATSAAAALLLGATVAGGCSSSESGPPTLTWYINPDNGGQATLAAKCTKAAKGRYRIETALLPNTADGQREQLVRRLAANDSSIDLMSLDVAFVSEFAHAGFLRAFDAEDTAALTDGVLPAPAQSARWDDRLVAAPFTATTQLLWYKKSVAKQAGVDPTAGPLTWAQLIAAAEQTDTTVEVQAKQYEGYVVWINALIVSAGGKVLADAGAGRDAKPAVDSKAGKTATDIIRTLARSSAADPQLDTSDEEVSRAGFQAASGGFMTNWTYVYGAAQAAVADGSMTKAELADIGWARYPRAVADQASAPPLGGIDIGVGAFSKHTDRAVEAVRCLTTAASQATYMIAEGNPAARAAVYDEAAVRKAFPMADLIRESIAAAGLRPQSPFYPDVSSALQRTFSPPRNVAPKTTPRSAASLITDVLADKALV